MIKIETPARLTRKHDDLHCEITRAISQIETALLLAHTPYPALIDDTLTTFNECASTLDILQTNLIYQRAAIEPGAQTRHVLTAERAQDLSQSLELKFSEFTRNVDMLLRALKNAKQQRDLASSLREYVREYKTVKTKTVKALSEVLDYRRFWG